ncbi:MAG TPA: response regulator [Leptolyngbyaceae cyanobacterium]
MPALPLEHKWVLVVEAETNSSALFTALFESAGAGVIVASSLNEALRVLDCFIPNVVISELVLPDGHGCDLAQHLSHVESELGLRVPAIAISAGTHPRAREQALAAGFRTYLTRPVEPDALVQKVVSLVHRCQG